MAMLKQRVVVTVMAAVMNMGCTHAADEPQFRVLTKRDRDHVKVTIEKDTTIFSVHSPFGISQAVIERAHGTWPDSILLQLHLKELEHFKVTNGKVTLDAAVSSQNGAVRLWKDDNENVPLDGNSPYWTNIRHLGGDGKESTHLPSGDGYFEIHLPKSLFEDNPKTITAQWIDFYR